MRINVSLIFLILIVSSIQVCRAAEENTYTKANKLFYEGNIAEAAIEYSKAKRDPYVSPPNRSIAQQQLEKCMHILRIDHQQTDKFYSLISLQKDNQMMRYLMYEYASLLESQGRYNELIKIHRQLYRLYPSASQKYTLARKLQQAGAVDEAFELYQELLDDKQYKRIALRHILENISSIASTKLDYLYEIARVYEKDITSDYQLLNLLVSALIDLKQPRKALEYSVKSAEMFPQYINSLTNVIYRQYKNKNITDADMADLIKKNKNHLTDDLCYFLAKIYGSCGEYKKALDILGASADLKILEYRAQLLYSSGSYAKAEELLKSMIARNNPRERWLTRLAEISFKMGKDDEAVKYLEDYIELKGGSNFNVYFYVGKTLERYGMADKAKQVYLKGKEVSSNKTYAVLELTKYYINQNQFYDAAYEIYESQRAQLLAPRSIYLSLANTIQDQKQFVELLENLDSIVTDKQTQDILKPKELSNLYYCIYSFYSEIGDMNKAVEFFKIYFSISPDNHNQLIEFCSWLDARGFYKETIDLLALMPDTSPFFRQSLSKRAELLISIGESKQAVELLESYPNKRNNFLLAKAYLESGKIENAKNLLKQISHKDPDYYLLEGDIFLNEHDVKSAVLSYQHIDKSAGGIYQKALWREAIANIFYQQYDEALLVFERLIKSAPSSAETVKSLKYRTIMALIKNTRNEELLKKWSNAEFMLWSGSTDEAVELYKELIAFNQKELYVPELRLLLYEIFLGLNDSEHAMSQLDKITVDFPDSSYAPMAQRMVIDLKNKVYDDVNVVDLYTEFLNSYPESYDSEIIRSELKLMGQTNND